MTEMEIKEQICDVCHKMWQLGWVAANDGNVSVKKLPDGNFICTPHRHQQKLHHPGKAGKNQRSRRDFLEANDGYRPSSEMKMHMRCYELRDDVGAVVHAHPPAATGFAVAHLPMDRYIMIEAVISLGSVPLTPFGVPSTKEVPDAIAPYLPDHDAMLLENHGAVTVGADLCTAYYRMETLELWAKIELNARLLGGEKEISEKEYRPLAGASEIRQGDGPPPGLPPLS